jgi:hypothetical protein
MGRDPLKAVIFVRGGADLVGRLTRCAEYCAARGYVVVATVTAADGEDRWGEVLRMLPCWCPAHDDAAHAGAGRADIIIVHDRTDLPPGRIPRWEAVSEGARVTAPRPRRPRRLWALGM